MQFSSDSQKCHEFLVDVRACAVAGPTMEGVTPVIAVSFTQALPKREYGESVEGG